MLKSIEVLGLGMEIPVKRIKKIEISFEGVMIDFSDKGGGDDIWVMVPLHAVRFIDDQGKTEKYSIETIKKAFKEALNIEPVNIMLDLDEQNFAAIVNAGKRGGYIL